jgi:hypothetical protein
MPDDIASAFACAKEGQIDRVISIVEKSGASTDVADAYSALVKWVYRERRDVTSMVALAEAACRYCTREAERLGEAGGKRLRERAKAIAYNAAANCWPGWGDDGVVIELQHLASGLELARQSCALVQELDLGKRELGTGHWLVGALELACARLSDAAASFALSEEAYHAHGDNAQVLMAQGYAALAHKIGSPSEEADLRLAQILDQLHAAGSKESLFFAEQIARAEPLLAAFAADLAGPRP